MKINPKFYLTIIYHSILIKINNREQLYYIYIIVYYTNKGFNVINAVNNLKWKTKESLKMFLRSVDRERK